MEKWFLLFIGCLAVFWDLWKGKIPNALIVAGLSAGWCFQLTDKGIYGALDFLGGAIFPLLLLGILFYFRMFGAGDIKLFLSYRRVSRYPVCVCLYHCFFSGRSAHLCLSYDQTPYLMAASTLFLCLYQQLYPI